MLVSHSTVLCVDQSQSCVLCWSVTALCCVLISHRAVFCVGQSQCCALCWSVTALCCVLVSHSAVFCVGQSCPFSGMESVISESALAAGHFQLCLHMFSGRSVP